MSKAKILSYLLAAGLFFKSALALGVPPVVVLLTALDPRSGKSIIRGSDWDGNLELEIIFRNRFEGSGYQIEVHHNADAETVWKVLHSSNTAAVFFVGHSAPQQSTAGIVAEGIIADRAGNNLGDLFKTVHPNIRVLGIVGCKSTQIFDGFRQQGFYNQNPNLKIISFDHLVDPFNYPIESSRNNGLTQAIGLSLDVLAKHQTFEEPFPLSSPCQATAEGGDEMRVRQCEEWYVSHRKVMMNPAIEAEFSLPMQSAQEQPAIVVHALRNIPSNPTGGIASSLTIIGQNRVLGVFPKGLAGQIQTLTFSLPFSVRGAKLRPDSSELKLTVEALRELNAQGGEISIIGELQFETRQLDGKWKPIVGKNKQPLGLSKHIYIWTWSLVRPI